ncbi:U2 snRNP-associated protein Uap2 [Melanomma pulvis-pyrius CBS 109.77]|uniref:U2 snRNP-associated protein Uap2 n=1 Tax=Melanomma pulvis-pyrius CBS 109.77 TaxID=1314802 RepID=A0A6A6XEP0_9PLEO|nr:U2 snRNP-associated protein Uap2 [Melanomma pulvis-pyrius CBS 109.77]
MHTQANYGNAADSEEQVIDPRVDKKRKKDAAAAANASNKKAKNNKAPENRAVYVTNIPRDATKDEIEELFKRFGIIDQSTEGTSRVKLYADENGDFNGEALIVYFKKDSVAMAITLQDDYPFRLGDDSTKVKVQEADMSYKKHTDGQVVKEKLVRKDKKATERHRAEMNRKLAEWSDDDEIVKETYAAPKNKWNKFAIIKGAFTLKELEEDDAAILDIKGDMREAAEECGDVTKVVLFDKEPEGILTVRFRQFEQAEAFVKKVHGRGYSGQKLQVTLAEDRPKFKKSVKGDASDSEEEAERLENLVAVTE